MEKETKSKIIFLIIDLIFAIILTNLGLFVYKENKAISVLTILISVVLIFFSFYAIQIKKNEKKIESLEEQIKDINKNIELDEKLLNTLKDICVLNKVKKIR